MNSSQYFIKASSVSSTLSALLGVDFSSHRLEGIPLASRVNNLVDNWFSSDPLSAWQNLELLEYLAKHLGEIKEARPDVLQEFRREFRRARIESQFFGLRFEAYVAASFVRKGIPFEKSESPDFRVDSCACTVECTTCHIVTEDKSRDLSYKVSSAIRGKAGSMSHRSDCALFIDVTNLFHFSFQSTANTFRMATAATLHETQFFSAILFTHIFNSDTGRIETICFREDNRAIGEEQKTFLNTYYPFSGGRSYEFYFPHSG